MHASRITIAAALVVAGTGAAAAAAMSPREIQTTFGTGKPFSAVSTSGGAAFWFTFNTDGTALAVWKDQSTRASGTWRLSADGYCMAWGTGAEHCFTIDRSGQQFDVLDANGNLIAYFSLASPSTANGSASARFADGSYTGPVVDAYYGLMQIQAVIKGGRLQSIKILKYPNDRNTSVYINRQALPMLRDEVISAQSANVDIISGATLSSDAFLRSLGAALAKAQL